MIGKSNFDRILHSLNNVDSRIHKNLAHMKNLTVDRKSNNKKQKITIFTYVCVCITKL